jgi:hypothetical protein
MSKRASILVVAIICICIGSCIGFLFGAAYCGSQMKNYILDANGSWLIQHINRLALIRTGRIEDAATAIENALNDSIIQLSCAGLDRRGEFHAERLPDTHLRALRVARTYADAGFRYAFSEESLHILDKVEPRDGKFSSPALRELQERGDRRR